MTDNAAAERPRRRRGTFADMVRSLGVVAIALVALMLVTLRHTPDKPYASPDVAVTVTAARDAAPFPVLALTALPQPWYANYANFDAVGGGAWWFHLGYVDGGARVVSVDATNEAAGLDAMPTPAPTGPRLRSTVVAGITFAVYADPSDATREVWVARGTGRDGHPWFMELVGARDDLTRLTPTMRATGTIAVTA